MTDPGFPSRRRLPKASDVLADLLRRRILSEGLEPGTRLPSEAQLIEQEQFSRSTVREALRILEIEQLVAIRRGPGGGVTVHHPDPTNTVRAVATFLTLSETSLRDLFDFRAATEPAAAALAARNATEAQRTELLLLADDASDEAEIGFHWALAEATNNGLFRVLLGSVSEVIRRHTADEDLDAHDREGASAAHRRMARAIATGDEDRASKAASLHIEEFKRRMGELGRLDQPIIPRSHWRAGA